MKKFIGKIQNILKNISNFIKNNDMEIPFLGGILCAIYASFLINKVVGFYTLGIFLLITSYLLAKYPKGGDK
ncbi:MULTISPECIES: hypothetical protein [Clostridium]|uniref:hypothetical protein n=1 Tax=Clostridium TaxID=1485 RepID=UPI000825A5A7|nr:MULTISPECIES: hypothetical protein [Clostridium]PJI09972.1 hypothetical protein CUB90_19790 [Clostridium sp. CT7]